MMKALTLTQPYATLIALGQKKIETRSWATNYRGPLAIHAAQGLGPVGGVRGLYDLCETEPFHGALRGMDLPHLLPKGAIVATCELVSCVEIDGRPTGFAVHGRKPNEEMMWWLTADEYAFGDYTPGRYAWLLANVRKLPKPIPAKGAQGLWNLDTLTEMAVKRQEIAAL